MKYQNLAAFENHLGEAAPANLARAYMVLSPDPVERRRLAEKIVTLTRGEKVQTSSSACLEILQTKPLFSPCVVAVVEEIENMKKQEAEALSLYLQNPSPFAYLVLTGSSFVHKEMYKSAKKELVLLDMSEEKPWDKKERLKKWLLLEAIKEKKTLTEECALFLLESVDLQYAALEQELFKLLTYVGEKKTITLTDAQAVCIHKEAVGLWKIAEELVWEEASLRHRPDEEMGSFLALCTHVRTQLDFGMRLARGEHLPTLKPQKQERNMRCVKKRGMHFFSQAYLLVYDAEIRAKDKPFSCALLWDHLAASIQVLK